MEWMVTAASNRIDDERRWEELQFALLDTLEDLGALGVTGWGRIGELGAVLRNFSGFPGSASTSYSMSAKTSPAQSPRPRGVLSGTAVKSSSGLVSRVDEDVPGGKLAIPSVDRSLASGEPKRWDDQG